MNFHEDRKANSEEEAENKAEEIIKAETFKRNVIEFEKKVDEINPLTINNPNNETINPKIDLDEELDNETINFFRYTLSDSKNNSANSELIDKIANLMSLIEKSSTLTNKHKNEFLRQMKDKFFEEQRNLISK